MGYKKEEPILTVEMFRKWNISVTLASKQLGFGQVNHLKGVYYDSHEREDVVAYGTNFLKT